MNSILVKKKIAETTFGVKNDFIFPSNSFSRIPGPVLIYNRPISGWWNGPWIRFPVLWAYLVHLYNLYVSLDPNEMSSYQNNLTKNQKLNFKLFLMIYVLSVAAQ